MTMLRIGLCLACGAALGLGGCGDDSRPPPRDAGPMTLDSSTPRDSGPRVDAGPIPDSGPAVDTGTPGMCPAGPCDILSQTGCMPGEGCYLSATGTQCAAAGTVGDGAACMNVNDCQEGFTCQDGACVHYCCGGSDSGCPTGQTCAIGLVDDMGNPTGAGLCRAPDTCDPLTQTGCTLMGDNCYLNGADGTVICISSTDDLTEGQDCGMVANACTRGLYCVMGACRAFCDTVDMDPSCPMGRTCTSLGIMGPGVSWGICMPPMM